jgi:cytochrome oxidase assembly protein ShyY1
LKKWINWVALVIVFSIACGFLSNWQFSRRETKLAAISLVQKNYESKPVPLSNLLDGNRFVLPSTTWRTVICHGNYLPEKALLVRNRPNDGNPGFEELVPFQVDNGQIVFVSRGWIPSGDKHDYPDHVSLPSGVTTTLTARIVGSEPVLNRTAPKGQIATINPLLAARLTDSINFVKNGYLRAVSEAPPVGDALASMPAPSTEEGNNLSYAMQWILFALMAAGALIWRIRKDQEEAKGIVRSKKLRRSDLDAEFEDETTKAK